MPRADPYYIEERQARHSAKPYDRPDSSDEEDDSPPYDSDSNSDDDDDNDDDDDDRWDMSELRDNLEAPTEPVDENIWNPQNRQYNCVSMGAAHASDRALDEVQEEDEPDSPLSEDEMQERAGRHGLRITDSPPPPEYFENGGRAAAIYRHDGGRGSGHVVEVDSGEFEGNFTYRDYQEDANGQDATQGVRDDPGRRYMHSYEDESSSDDDSD